MSCCGTCVEAWMRLCTLSFDVHTMTLQLHGLYFYFTHHLTWIIRAIHTTLSQWWWEKTLILLLSLFHVFCCLYIITDIWHCRSPHVTAVVFTQFACGKQISWGSAGLRWYVAQAGKKEKRKCPPAHFVLWVWHLNVSCWTKISQATEVEKLSWHDWLLHAYLFYVNLSGNCEQKAQHVPLKYSEAGFILQDRVPAYHYLLHEKSPFSNVTLLSS